MIKFKYNYQENTLAYQTKTTAKNTWYQLTEEQQFPGNFGGQGFKLDDGWITFTIRANKIKVFYKQISPSWADQVEKVNGQWVKKGETK